MTTDDRPVLRQQLLDLVAGRLDDQTATATVTPATGELPVEAIRNPKRSAAAAGHGA